MEKKTRIKNLKMKNFIAQKKSRKDQLLLFQNKPTAKMLKSLSNPLEKLKKLRSSKIIEMDLFKKLKQKKEEFQMTKSTRLLKYANDSQIRNKQSGSRRGSLLLNQNQFSSKRSIKMLSQRHIEKSKTFKAQGKPWAHFSKVKTSAIDPKSTVHLSSKKNVTSLEFQERNSAQSLLPELGRDATTLRDEIEKIEEVESLEENLPNLEASEEKSAESREIVINLKKSGAGGQESNTMKSEIRGKLKSLAGGGGKGLEALKSEIPRKFKYWKKHDLVEIYNFKSNIHFFEIQKKIGKGSFGKVYLAKQLLTGAPVALKVISKKSLKRKKAEQRIEKEIKILKSIPSHANVIRFLEIFQDCDYHYFVFEFAELGDLVSYFYKEDLFPEDRLRVFFRQFLNGLQHLHECNIIHRDIKPDNILMDKNFTPKIADFGISNIFDSNEVIRDTGGTPLYLSPEVIENQGRINFQTDVWSAGIVLYLLVFGDTPFKGQNINELFLQILSKEVNFDVANDFKGDQGLIKDLIKKMLTKNPEKRITIKQIFEHKWMRICSTVFEKFCFSNSEHEEQNINLYELNANRKIQYELAPERVISSCRNIANSSWTEEYSPHRNEAPDQMVSDPSQNANQREISRKSQKFITYTSTQNTNQKSPTNVQKRSVSGLEPPHMSTRSSIIKEVIVEYLKEIGFPEEYVLQSIDPSKKIFNHVRGCFENLKMIL